MKRFTNILLKILATVGSAFLVGKSCEGITEAKRRKRAMDDSLNKAKIKRALREENEKNT